MESSDWPTERWELTAPESYVLQIPRPLSAAEALKLGLRELVLRRALRLIQPESGRLLGRRRARTFLRAGPEYGAISNRVLRPLLEVHGRVPERPELNGVRVEDFAKEARREFTRGFARYLDDCVYPSLVERGLMQPSERRRAVLFPQTVYVRTPTGKEAAAELEEWLRVGRARVEEWTHDSPERALAYAGGAGAAILLMPSLFPEFDQLRRLQGDLGAVGAHDFGGADLGALDFGSLDFGSLDFGGLDAGIDAGGGFGGDGGGGGGNGGG